MVKSERYTCNICNKMFSSASSIWNHRTKYHKSEGLIEHQPIISQASANNNHTSVNKISTQLDEAKIYNCRKCNKTYKHIQSRFKHELICDKTTEIISTINNTTNNTNSHNNTNNGTINNTANNTIVINNFNEDNIKYLKDDYMKRILMKLCNKNDTHAIKTAIPFLIGNIKFNRYHKENNNAMITNNRSKIGKQYINNKWEYVKKDQLLKDLHNKAVEILQNWVKQNKDTLTEKMLDAFKDYDNVSVEFKKKVIHEEINMIAYLHYKNHVEPFLNEDEIYV